MLLLLHKSLGQATGLLATFGLFTAVDFNHTITLGSVLIAFIILAIAGVFTIRSKIATIWREEAEGERAAKERAEEALIRERGDRVVFERQQQELRHDLKNEVAGLKAQLKAVEARTDLSSAITAIKDMNQDSLTVSLDAHRATQDLLKEIRDKLPSEPIAIVPVSPEEQRREKKT